MQKLDDGVVRVIQLSDCHLGADDRFTLAGINTSQSFRRVLARLENQLPACDLVAVTGDVAADGERAAYELFERAMPEGTPFAWLPGNHDNFSLMQGVMRQPFRRLVALNGWVLIFLVSAVPGRVGGQLADGELAELAQLLENCRDRHVALFVHHPPAEINCHWLDQQRIANHRALAELLAGFDQVRALFSGHVHQGNATRWAGIPVYSAPSTCFQFAPGSDEFDLCEQPPGYRWIHLRADGAIDTGVEFVGGDAQQVDRHCIGY
ncbi:phosphodiesterase [Porticoccus sp.]